MYCYGGNGKRFLLKEPSGWLKADLQGNAPAQYNLGRSIIAGVKAWKDLQQAQFWFPKAIDNGHEKAKEALTKIKATYQKDTQRLVPVSLTIR